MDVARVTQVIDRDGFVTTVNNIEGGGRGLPAVLQNPMGILDCVPGLFRIAQVALSEFAPKIVELLKSLQLELPMQFADRDE